MKKALLVAAFLLASCLGSRVAREANFPPLNLASDHVEGFIERGILDGRQDGDLSAVQAEEIDRAWEALDAALEAKSVEGVRSVTWSDLETWALRGVQDQVDDGEVAPGVAESFREEILNFSLSLMEVAR